MAYRNSFGEAFLDKPLSQSIGGGGGGAATIANGADTTQGAIADVAATPGSAGTLSSKLRLITTQLDAVQTALGLVASKAGPGASSIGRVTASVTQVQVGGARPTRRALTIKNADDALTVSIGGSGVTADSGFPLGPGEGITVTVTHAIFCIAASGSPSVAFFEEYD